MALYINYKTEWHVGEPIPTEGLTLHDRKGVTETARTGISSLLSLR